MAAPHVFIFPLPLHGPVNCMLKLAELLCLHQEIHITFINTQYIHQRLPMNYTDVLLRFEKYPNFKFVTVPEDNPRNGDQIGKIIESVKEASSPLFREMVMSTNCASTCLIVDVIFTFALHIAKEAKIPLLYLDTISPCAIWTYLALPKLIEAGQFHSKVRWGSVGLNMKDVCDRATIERMVREVMDVKKIEFLERAKETINFAIASIGENGASYQDLERLIEDITCSHA